ncbi:MAG TPA: VOC family protein [Phycisphaerae bacterium]|nr:VOC family protein [Phycisphaerae bacterium]
MRDEPVGQRIAQVTLVVREYDEAIRFYTETLGFVLLEDTDLGGGKRWVRVAPAGGAGVELLLARAVTEEQRGRVGDQTGGRVFLFLETDDFWRDYEALRAKGIEFVRPPREEVYGTVAVLQDLYGNKIDLIEPKEKED